MLKRKYSINRFIISSSKAPKNLDPLQCKVRNLQSSLYGVQTILPAGMAVYKALRFDKVNFEFCFHPFDAPLIDLRLDLLVDMANRVDIGDNYPASDKPSDRIHIYNDFVNCNKVSFDDLVGILWYCDQFPSFEMILENLSIGDSCYYSNVVDGMYAWDDASFDCDYQHNYLHNNQYADNHWTFQKNEQVIVNMALRILSMKLFIDIQMCLFCT